ncbi:hypothetical protein MMC07_005757 [Pseudocyphellaria aurata]|nr:hypothetical protein [Pseudocyphellaria aurata]
MEPTSITSKSPISLIPAEILNMILRYAMRSETSVHLELFVQLGHRLQDVCDAKITEHSQQDFSEILRTDVKRWFLSRTGSTQGEHYQDWLLINATCRGFRKWGKKAFFSEKVFVIRPAFLKSICDATTRVMSAANVAIARRRIQHVIVPLAVVGMGGQFITLPRYHALPSLRSLSLQYSCTNARVLSHLMPPGPNRYPVPKELETLLREIGLRVDQLQLDLEMDEKSNESDWRPPRGSNYTDSLTKHVYPCLRAFSFIKAREATRIRP